MTLQLDDLGCVGLLRVLRIVFKNGPINISHLARRAGMNHTSIDRHVKKLIDRGVIYERRYGQIRMIKSTCSSLTIQFKKGMDVKIEKTQV